MHRYTLQMLSLHLKDAWQCLRVLPFKGKVRKAAIPNHCKLFI